MKKTLLGLLLIVAIIAVSCSQDSVAQDDLISIRFTKLEAKAIDSESYDVSSDATWGGANVQFGDASNYYWTYKATKQGGGFTTGQTTAFENWSEDKDLTGSKKFSSGSWKFELKAYVSTEDRKNGTNAVFTGEATTENLTSNTTVSVPMTFTYVTGQGSVNFTISTTVTRPDGSSFAITKLEMVIGSTTVELTKKEGEATSWTGSKSQIATGQQKVQIKVYVDSESEPTVSKEIGTAYIMYGLTTNVTGSATITISKLNDISFSTDSKVWDGTVDTTWYAEDKTEFTLTKASQLAGLASLVNSGNTFEGKTISLGNDINLNNIQWTPIGLYKDEIDNDIKRQFSGTFNGNNHTIDGLKINSTTGKSSYRALFGYVDGTVKDFTLKGEVSGIDVAGVVAALDKGGVVKNVTSYVNVSNTDVNATQAKTAGIVLTIKDKNSKEAGWTISNCKNYGTISSNSTVATDSVGGIFGWASDQTSKIKITNCENHGAVSASNQPAGGIVGGCRSIIIEGCTNSGDISSTSSAGGIIAYNDTVDLTIKNCSNSGNVTGTEGKTGAIGGYIRGTLTDCTNTASGINSLVGSASNNVTTNTTTSGDISDNKSK